MSFSFLVSRFSFLVCAGALTVAAPLRADDPSGWECAEEPEGPALDVQLASASGEVEVALGGSFRLHVTNGLDRAVPLVVQRRLRTDAGKATLPPVEDMMVGGLTTSEIEVSLPDSPLLKNATFDVSGKLVVTLGTMVDGQFIARSDPLYLYFHREETRWVIYDEQTRDKRWDGGALSRDAKLARLEALALGNGWDGFASRGEQPASPEGPPDAAMVEVLP